MIESSLFSFLCTLQKGNDIVSKKAFEFICNNNCVKKSRVPINLQQNIKQMKRAKYSNKE